MDNRFYKPNARRFTYEYTRYVYSFIENNSDIGDSMKQYLLTRIRAYNAAFKSDLITTREYMYSISNIYTMAYNETV